MPTLSVVLYVGGPPNQHLNREQRTTPRGKHPWRKPLTARRHLDGDGGPRFREEVTARFVDAALGERGAPNRFSSIPDRCSIALENVALARRPARAGPPRRGDHGPESSGKETTRRAAPVGGQRPQAAGGIAAFIDAEHALDPDYAPESLGGDTDSLLVQPARTPAKAGRWRSLTWLNPLGPRVGPICHRTPPPSVGRVCRWQLSQARGGRRPCGLQAPADESGTAGK